MEEEVKELNARVFEDVECCACGAHSGAYLNRDEDGSWYVCNDCDKPIFGTYRVNEQRINNGEDEYYD